MADHHYLPKHFQRGWELPSKKGYIYSYFFSPHAQKVLGGERAISSSCAEDDLYILAPDANLELELTQSIDSQGAAVINKLRRGDDICTEREAHALFRYVTFLRSRNPDAMESLRQGLGPEIAHMVETTQIDETEARRAAGVLSLSLVEVMCNTVVKKYHCMPRPMPADMLITSNNPVPTLGDDDVVLLAVSPRRLLIFAKDPDIGITVGLLPPKVLAKRANLEVLRHATIGISQGPQPFVERYLGWGASQDAAQIERQMETEILAGAERHRRHVEHFFRATGTRPVGALRSAFGL